MRGSHGLNRACERASSLCEFEAIKFARVPNDAHGDSVPKLSVGHRGPVPNVFETVTTPNADSGRAALAEGCFLGTAGLVLCRHSCPRVRARSGRRIAGTICAATALLPGRCWFVPVTPWAT